MKILYISALTALCFGRPLLLQAQDKSQALPEAVTGSIAEQHRRFADFFATYTYSSVEGDKSHLVRTERLKVSAPGACKVIEEANGTARARVTNAKYTFLVERKVKDGPWLLVDLVLTPNAPIGGDAEPVTEEVLKRAMQHALLFGRFIPQAFEEKVEPSRIERMDAHGNKLKLTLTSKGSKPLLPGVAIKSMWIVLDKEFGWTCREAFFETSRPNGPNREYSLTYELAVNQDGIAYPRSITTTVTDPTVSPPKVVGQTKEEYDFRFRTKTPGDEFTLTAYGLPEPTGFEARRKTPTYVWWVVGGAAFLVLAAGLRLWRRKPK